MDNKELATETTAETIAPQENQAVIPQEEDLGAKVEALEKERAQLIAQLDVDANYKLAYLKEKGKNKQTEEPEDIEETVEDKMRRIAAETLANSRLAEINRQQAEINAKALRENKELKLALLNKPGTPASLGTHSEGPAVKDHILTDEQLAHFKALGKDDKWIENYKKNLMKGGGR